MNIKLDGNTGHYIFELSKDDFNHIKEIEHLPEDMWGINCFDKRLNKLVTLRLVFSKMKNNKLTWHLDVFRNDDFDDAKTVSEMYNGFNGDEIIDLQIGHYMIYIGKLEFKVV